MASRRMSRQAGDSASMLRCSAYPASSANQVIHTRTCSAKARKSALARLDPQPGSPSLLVVATGPYIGEGFDCPALDTLFLAAPVGYKGSIVQWAERIMRTYPGKATAEIHDYHDVRTPVLASSLARRTPGYIHLGFPDPRRASSSSPSAS